MKSPRLGKLVTHAIDNALQQAGMAHAFLPEKEDLAGTLARYGRRRTDQEVEIFFYKDKRWHRDEGGTFYAEVSCLVHEVQRAVHGVDQSLLKPDQSRPFGHFQYSLMEASPLQSWEIHGTDDLPSVESQLAGWFRDVAQPWLAHFDTMEGTMAYLAAHGADLTLAMLCATRGRVEEARHFAMAWLAHFPRRIDARLARLAGAGVFTAAEHAYLASASLQAEEQYAELLSQLPKT